MSQTQAVDNLELAWSSGAERVILWAWADPSLLITLGGAAGATAASPSLLPGCHRHAQWFAQTVLERDPRQSKLGVMRANAGADRPLPTDKLWRYVTILHQDFLGVEAVHANIRCLHDVSTFCDLPQQSTAPNGLSLCS